MKVAIVLFALVAVALADKYSSGYKYQDSYHVPYYKFDWAVKDEYYNDYGQHESREADHTKGNWWVSLPGQSHIKNDYDVNSHSYGGYSGSSYGKDYKKSY